MKIATWNVNSIIARLPVVRRWMDVAQPDVLCLQEIKCVEEKFPREAFAELGYAAEVYGQPTYNGVAIVSRNPTCSDGLTFADGTGDWALTAMKGWPLSTRVRWTSRALRDQSTM